MFRALLRKKQQLTEEECIALLTEQTRGVLSVLGDGDYPYGMPMNHLYLKEDGCIYFHCGRVGHRLDAIRRHDRVSFCVFDAGERTDHPFGLTVRSVIVFGKMEIVEDEKRIAHITRLISDKFTKDKAYVEQEIRAFLPATLVLRLVPEHMCGKRVCEA